MAKKDRPQICAYCKGTDPHCGFCDGGVPLDTQEDWDSSWGRILGDANDIADRFIGTKEGE